MWAEDRLYAILGMIVNNNRHALQCRNNIQNPDYREALDISKDHACQSCEMWVDLYL